ncbi:MAG: MerR family transcriptional regulator [Nevskiales bacterium]
MTSADELLTIEELSFRSGVTTRNIRAYQSRGLIPSPETRPGERVGYYRLEHLARLRLINRMQERGFSLAGIAVMLQAWSAGRSLDQVLGMETAVEETRPDDSQLVDDQALRALTPPGQDADQLIQHLRGLGLLVREGSRYRVSHPGILRLGVTAAAAGIPIEQLQAEFERIQQDAHRIARRFVQLYNDYVWKPYLESGMPSAGLPQIVESMKQLRLLAEEVVRPLMADALTDEIDAIAGENLPMPDTLSGESKPG